MLSFEQAVAAPLCTARLADSGARVIKIERCEVGDFARKYDTFVQGRASSYFSWLNRGKVLALLMTITLADTHIALIIYAREHEHNALMYTCARMSTMHTYHKHLLCPAMHNQIEMHSNLCTLPPSLFIFLAFQESLSCDIKDANDCALIHRILSKADVFVQNLAPGACARAGFGSADLRKRYPHLITVITPTDAFVPTLSTVSACI